MAKSTRKVRRGGASSAPRSKSRFAVSVVSAAALVVLAYQFAFATGQVGYLPDYGPTTDPGDPGPSIPGGGGSASGSGSGSGSAALYSGVGALAVGAVTECLHSKPSASLPSAPIAEIRLVADQATMDAGTTSCFHLQGRTAGDEQWHDLTQRSETQIEVEGAESGLVRQQGSNHRFALPITASPQYDGRVVKVRARYTPKGAAPLTCETEVTLSVRSN